MPVVPLPPENLANPNVVELAAKTILHRVHAPVFAGNDFNPCRGGLTRFAPIRNRNGRCVPSLYAGNSVESAINETIFHEAPLTSGLKTVPLSAVESRNHSTLQIKRNLRLAGLRAPDLAKWGLSRELLIGGPPSQYKRTALWAQAIHAKFGNIHGLIWTSNLCDPDDSLLLFGDRVSDQDIEIVAERNGADGSFLLDVRNAGERAGIQITL